MRGSTVLVVEEEYLIAADIEYSLVAEGASVLTVRDVAEARTHNLAGIDLVILEAKLGDPAVVDFAAQLRERGIGVVVTSADRTIQLLFTGSVPLEKPFVASALLAACATALREARRSLDQV